MKIRLLACLGIAAVAMGLVQTAFSMELVQENHKVISATFPMATHHLAESNALRDLTRIAHAQRQEDRQMLQSRMDVPNFCFQKDPHRDPITLHKKTKSDLNELMIATDPSEPGFNKTTAHLANLIAHMAHDVNELGICNAQCVTDPMQSLSSKRKNLLANLSLLDEIIFFTDNDENLIGISDQDIELIIDISDQCDQLIKQGIRYKKIIKNKIILEDAINEQLNSLMRNSRFINATKQQRLEMTAGGSLGILMASKHFGKSHKK